MKNVHVVGVLCGLVLSSFAFGCASTPGAAAPLKTSPPTAAAAAATPSQASDDIWIGPTRGESSDAAVLAWQTEILQAIGRDGQFCLFNYAVAGDGSVFVAIDYAPLALSPDQMNAASAVQAKFAGSAAARSHGKMWMAAQAGESSARVAAR